MKSRDSSVGTATDYGLDDRMIGVRILVGAGNFTFRHRVQTGYGAHPASYSMDTWGSFPRGKAAEARNWPLTSIQCLGQRIRGAIPPLSQYAFMAWCSVKARGHLYLLPSTLESMNLSCACYLGTETSFLAFRTHSNRPATWLFSASWNAVYYRAKCAV
jgi:hypothetical protein